MTLRVGWLLLGALVVAGLVYGAGSVPLLDPDEGRNAEVAREMAAAGDWVVPHLNGLPYLDKPIVLFATSAAFVRALGATELAARAAPLLATLLTSGLLAAFARRRFGTQVAAVAAVALSTSPLVVGFSRIAIFDALLMLGVAAACLAFHNSWETGSLRWIVVGWAAVGISCLTKGPVGLALPVLINVVHALATGRKVRRLFHPLGLLVFVLVVAPWVLAMATRHPEFLHYAFVRETFERVTTDRMRRTGPVYYFVPWVLLGAFPWTLALLGAYRPLAEAWRRRRDSGGPTVYLALWVAVPFVLFSASQSKRPGYILPAIPALALLCAALLAGSPGLRRNVLRVFAGIALALGATLAILSGRLGARIDPDYSALASVVPGLARALGAALLACGAVAIWPRVARSLLTATVCLAAVPLAIPLLGHDALVALGSGRSARGLAEAIETASPGRTRVVGVGAFPPSLAYYLRRPILLSTTSGFETGSNYVMEYLDELRARPGSTLRAPEWWVEAIDRCDEPTVLVTPRRGTARERVAAAGLTLIAEEGGFAAWGPCRPRPAERPTVKPPS